MADRHPWSSGTGRQLSVDLPALQPKDGRDPFWNEAQTVTVKNGLFSVLLGAATQIPSVPDRDTSYFARAVPTHPYADSAGGAQRVGGYNITGLDARYVNEEPADAVSSTMIQDGAVTMSKINQSGATTGQVMW